MKRTNVPVFYAKVLGPKLKDKLTEMLELPHHKQVSLYEELALSRMAATEAVELASIALDPPEGSTVSDASRHQALIVLQAAMAQVKEMVVAASRIEKDAEDKVSLRVVDLFVLQVTKAIARVCGEDNRALGEAIVEEIEESVRLPRPGSDPNVTVHGEVQTPAEAAAEMDATIMGSDNADDDDEGVA